MQESRKNNYQHSLRIASIMGLAIFLVIAPTKGVAQTTPSAEESAEEKVVSLFGLEADQAVKYLGPPDKKISDTVSGRETWYYGKSVLFFSNGKITAWSDSGDLLERQSAKQQQRDSFVHDPFAEEGWENPWTPPQSVSVEDVVNEIVE